MLLKQMEYFQAVVECGNFYRAAEKCYISQSAIFHSKSKSWKVNSVYSFWTGTTTHLV